MKSIKSEDLRNVAIIGHGQSGKTSLVSALLFNSGMVNRLGKVEQGNSVTDYEEEDIAKKISIQASLAYAIQGNNKLNIIDTPGYANFIWEARVALRAVETGVIVVNSIEGVEVQTEKVFDAATDLNKSVVFVVNKMSKDLADFDKTMESIVESFGKKCRSCSDPDREGESFKGVVDLIKMKAFEYVNDESGKPKEIEIPGDLKDSADSLRESLIEKIAENDEALMEKYFEDGDLTQEEIAKGLRSGILSRDIFPVLITDAVNNFGADQVQEFIINYCPSPIDAGEVNCIEGSVKSDPSAKFTGFVFKTISDPFTGKISIIRSFSGMFKPDSSYYNINKSTEERLGGFFALQGKTQESCEAVFPGDIIAVAKLKETKTGDTLTIKGEGGISGDQISDPFNILCDRT